MGTQRTVSCERAYIVSVGRPIHQEIEGGGARVTDELDEGIVTEDGYSPVTCSTPSIASREPAATSSRVWNASRARKPTWPYVFGSSSARSSCSCTIELGRSRRTVVSLADPLGVTMSDVSHGDARCARRWVVRSVVGLPVSGFLVSGLPSSGSRVPVSRVPVSRVPGVPSSGRPCPKSASAPEGGVTGESDLPGP